MELLPDHHPVQEIRVVFKIKGQLTPARVHGSGVKVCLQNAWECKTPFTGVGVRRSEITTKPILYIVLFPQFSHNLFSSKVKVE